MAVSGRDLAQRVSRPAAGLLALGINLALLTLLVMPGQGVREHPADPPERVVLWLAQSEATAERTLPPRAAPRLHRISRRLPQALLERPLAEGPPTETRAAVLENVRPDSEATVLDPTRLREICQRVYPEELTSERAVEATMLLRVFVMPDGRIGQGAIIRSSGDARLDRLTLQCLQAYAYLDTVGEDPSYTGGWQRLSWQWFPP